MRKVWTYLSAKALTAQECEQLLAEGKRFVESWTAHEMKLDATFQIHRNRILIVSVDETAHNASGCSIDKLLRFVKEIEKQFSTELLNRLLVAVDGTSEIEVYKSAQLPELIANGKISASTPVYNTSITNEGELKNWIQPLSNTWLNKYLQN